MDFGPTTQQFDSATPAQEALPAGTRLGGYQIVELLGRGRTSLVYLALDSSLQRQVAIKEYLPPDLAYRDSDRQISIKPGADVAAFARGKAAFLDNAKALARIEHPALVHVHSVWEQNRSAYLVMGYHPGRPLAAELASRTTPPDETWLRALLTPLLGALGALHHEQHLHLAIAPESILIRTDGQPVLLGCSPATGTPPRYPAYAPIEQLDPSPKLDLGAWTDLYALAGVVYHAIAGEPPAPAPARAARDRQLPLADTVALRAQAFPGLHYTKTFLAAIDKALAVNPKRRPASTADFQHLLDTAEVPRAATPRRSKSQRSAPPHTPLQADAPHQPFAAPVQRRRPVWLIGALAGLALIAVAGWMWLQPTAHTVQEPSPAARASVTTAAPTPTPMPAPVASSAMAASSPTIQIALPAPPDAAPAPTANDAAVVEATPAVASPPKASASARRKKTIKPEEETSQAAAPASPSAACGARKNFSLLYCMQRQCKRPAFAKHPQCEDLRRRGEL